ncbi:MAG TPA: thiamine pyrophosphate-dependent enzyme [Steroidobacteraceae bacterium]|jgi:acetolactate synthase-1/2/3 large subunit
MTTNAAQRLVETLIANDVTHVFCVPGESYLAVLDAFVDVADKIKVIACRHEAGAVNMAVAHGKLTGRPGICFVTRGPGATHASIGVHTAAQDSVPMILFVGQIARGDRGREAFQELDYPAVFGSMAKFSVEIDDPRRMVELTTRAFATAMQGRMGPVVVALPEDMLVEAAGPRMPMRVVPAIAGLDPSLLPTIAERLEKSERPLLILGGTGWTDDALRRFATWAQASELPVVLSWRRKDLMDNDHPCYVGDLNIRPNPSLSERIKSADLIIALGARLGDVPMVGYTLLSTDDVAKKLIHIHAAAEEPNRVWQPSLAAIANPAAAALALSGLKLQRKWSAWRAAARADYEKTLTPIATVSSVNLSQVAKHLDEVLPHDAILCSGAGNYTTWTNRFYRYRAFHTQLAPTSGAMGFGFPAAIAAKIVWPEKEVICLAGDGCFLMTAQELATAVQYDVRLITLVIDNGSYGTIRMHQERDYPGRVSATDIRNPDFVAYAKAFGAWGAKVERTEDFAAAFAAARAAQGPALLHLKVSVEDILPGQRLTQS